MSIDARLEHAAAKPVIDPDAIVIDHGKVFISDTFTAACRTLCIAVQPARPATPTGKGVVERTFSSINTLFCQHVAGYVGLSVTQRGQDVEAVWTLRELSKLWEEWLMACWQSRPHDGLRSPFLPNKALSPNEVYALLVTRAGHLPVCLTGDDSFELLPAEWRKINDYGIVMDYRTYDCRELGPIAASPPASRSRASSGRSTTTPTTCRTSGSATAERADGSPSRGPGWARSPRRSRTSPGATPALCRPPAARMTPFRHKTPQAQAAWQALVATLENALRLHAHRPDAFLRLAPYLHDRTAGMIGSLSHLVREAALDAILDGTERITRAGLEAVDLDESVEWQNIPWARQRRTREARRTV
ncbi:hypothetical protein ACWENA_09895 [Streptomyces sp. NPDC004779]